MEIFGNDIIIGDFRASDFGLTLGSTDYDGNSDDEMGNDITIAEQFIGRNPVPVYLDYTYSEKLKPTITLIKYNCSNSEDMNLSEFEVRNIIRLLTGYHGYKWMKIVTDDISEDTWYKVKIINTALVRRGGFPIGIKISMECDSQFGYSPIQTINVDAVAYEPFKIFNNSDDIYSYLLPELTITVKEEGNLDLINNTEEWTTKINNVVVDEIISMDSEKKIMTSTASHPTVLLDDFNLHWVRMINGVNEFVTNLNCDIQFKYRMRRKGGFVCR